MQCAAVETELFGHVLDCAMAGTELQPDQFPDLVAQAAIGPVEHLFEMAAGVARQHRVGLGQGSVEIGRSAKTRR